MPGIDLTDPHQQLVVENMTTKRALRIRHLRVQLGYTYRKIADATWEDWGEAGSAGYDVGFALVIVAADMLGENAWEEPWLSGVQ